MAGGEVLQKLQEPENKTEIKAEDFDKIVNIYKNDMEKWNADAKEILNLKGIKEIVEKNVLTALDKNNVPARYNLNTVQLTDAEKISIMLAVDSGATTNDLIFNDIFKNLNTTANKDQKEKMKIFLSKNTIVNTYTKEMGESNPDLKTDEEKKEASHIKFKIGESDTKTLEENQLQKLEKLNPNKMVVFAGRATLKDFFLPGEKISEKNPNKTVAEADYDEALNNLGSKLGKSVIARIDREVKNKIANAKDLHEQANGYLAITRALNCAILYLDKIQGTPNEANVKKQFENAKFTYEVSTDTDVRVLYEERETVVIDLPLPVHANFTFSEMYNPETKQWSTVIPNTKDNYMSVSAGFSKDLYIAPKVETDKTTGEHKVNYIKGSEESIYKDGKLKQPKDLNTALSETNNKFWQNEDDNLRLDIREYSLIDFAKTLGIDILYSIGNQTENQREIVPENITSAIDYTIEQLKTYGLYNRTIAPHFAGKDNQAFIPDQTTTYGKALENIRNNINNPNASAADIARQLRVMATNVMHELFKKDADGNENPSSPTSGRSMVFGKLEPDYLKIVDSYKNDAINYISFDVPQGKELYQQIIEVNKVKFNDNIRELKHDMISAKHNNKNYDAATAVSYDKYIQELDPQKIDMNNLNTKIDYLKKTMIAEPNEEIQTKIKEILFPDDINEGLNKNQRIIENITFVQTQTDKAKKI